MVQVEGTNAGKVWFAVSYVLIKVSISKVICVQVSVISCLVCVTSGDEVCVCVFVSNVISVQVSVVSR